MSRQIFEYHPTLGYRFIPSIKARVPHGTGAYLIRTNNLGFRSDYDFERAKPPGVSRLLLFGDSFTAGDCVSNGKRYGDVLERKIDGLQVYNFGLPGTGSDQQYLAYREYATEIEHDMLVIAVLVENVRRVTARLRLYHDERGEKVYYAKPYYELIQGALQLRNTPVPKRPFRDSEIPEEDRANVDHGGRFERLREVVGQLGLRDVVQRLSRYQPVPEYNRASDPGWLLLRAILERWIGESGRPVLVMPIPLYQFVEEAANPANYQARFRELAAATGCALHDPLPDLQRHSLETRRGFRFGQDPHLTPAGHAALADSLVAAIEPILRRRKDPVP